MNRRDLLLLLASSAISTTYLSGCTNTNAKTIKPTKNKFEVTKTDREWAKILTPEQFDVLRKQGTERAGTSELTDNHRKGIYACAGCNLPLFTSDTKFESGTGWPSFYQSISGAVVTTTDNSAFMSRIEVNCRRCGGHLGHVFDDGPKPTGKRYCMNGISMKFIPS